MEPYEDLLSQAQRQVEIAQHMLAETYPLVNDPKMLPLILERMYQALDYGLTAILRFERNHKRLGSYKDEFEHKTEVFEKKIAPRYKLKRKYCLEEIRKIVIKHRKSPIAFARKHRLIIVEDEKINTLDVQKLKSFLSRTKVFIHDIHHILRTQILKTGTAT